MRIELHMRLPRPCQIVATKTMVVSLGLTLAGCATTPPRDNAGFHEQCRQAIAKQWPQWRPRDVSSEVREWAATVNEDPTVAHGDFDDDGKEDVALLIQLADRSDSVRIVVCLSSVEVTQPMMIGSPYCSDGIGSTSKGKRYYDYGTDSEGTYPRDGIHAYCFEKAGATYIYEGASFREIIDSD